jgi:hypothetical protein
MYQNKFYQQTMDIASDSPSTNPFRSIRMRDYQASLMTALIDQNQNELFGR